MARLTTNPEFKRLLPGQRLAQRQLPPRPQRHSAGGMNTRKLPDGSVSIAGIS